MKVMNVILMAMVSMTLAQVAKADTAEKVSGTIIKKVQVAVGSRLVRYVLNADDGQVLQLEFTSAQSFYQDCRIGTYKLAPASMGASANRVILSAEDCREVIN